MESDVELVYRNIQALRCFPYRPLQFYKIGGGSGIKSDVELVYSGIQALSRIVAKVVMSVVSKGT
jgi:hypothetical protein